MILGLTGGIACGKSTVLNRLRERMSWHVVDADRIVRDLLAGDEGVRVSICERIDSRAYDAQGQVDRRFLREMVFANQEIRQVLESILHPRVREIWQAAVHEARSAGSHLVVDIPLLFETHAESEFDAVVAVLCSRELQEARLLEKRGLSVEIAKKMIASQLSSRIKMEKSDFVIWNDGSLNALVSQTDQLAHVLTHSFYG